MANASYSYYCGGNWCDFPYAREPRKPKIKVTHATPSLVKFTLTDTDVSMANMLRRIMLAEVPTMAIEIVNISDNDTVLFDEFLAHRMGLLPMASHSVGDIPPDIGPDHGYMDFKDCNCFDGCPYCTAELALDVEAKGDKVLSVTHFDLAETHRFTRENWTENKRVRPVPLRSPDMEEVLDTRENGIILCKMKKDQNLRMVCHARKGIAKYHAKWMPVATAIYNYQPQVELDRPQVDSLTIDERIQFVQACPRKVFGLDIEDKVQVERLNDCIFCDECVNKAKNDFGKKTMVTVKHDQNMFHFKVDAVTEHGPRSAIDCVRAALRIFDYKLSLFLQDAYGDDITTWLPRLPANRSGEA
mmetsp:Transcript_67117/g.143614  ORF Transcript_67117/g.143614 Transcript_67117/m.143614 type:complete len:358 (+) Transcript_67117:70-1143(+)